VVLLSENGDDPAWVPCFEKSKAGLEVTTAAVASADSVDVDGVPKLNEDVVVAVVLTGAKKENESGMVETAGLLENAGVDAAVIASLVWLVGLKPNAGAGVGFADSLAWLTGLNEKDGTDATFDGSLAVPFSLPLSPPSFLGASVAG
jgi:hypothetical protein